MDHAEFARLKRQGLAGLQMEDSVARSLVEQHPRMPRNYRSPHTFWAWVWMVTAVISCGLIPLLFGIRAAINKSAREFVLDFAEQDRAFYEEGLAHYWFTLITR